MRRTLHFWLCLTQGGRALSSHFDCISAFETRAEAEQWAHNNCSARPRIVKFVPQHVGGQQGLKEYEQ